MAIGHVRRLWRFVIAAPLLSSAATAQDLRDQALVILDTHCVRCHSPQSNNKSAKSEIADMLDVGTLLRRGRIVAGDPDRSQIYRLVRDDKMPDGVLQYDGLDLGSTPVSEAEKDILRRWISELE